MTEVLPTGLLTVIGQLGFAGVFWWLFREARQERKDATKELQERIEEKETRLRNVQDQVLTVFQQNVKMQEGVKNSLDRNTEAMNRYTTVTDKLSGRVEDALKAK